MTAEHHRHGPGAVRGVGRRKAAPGSPRPSGRTDAPTPSQAREPSPRWTPVAIIALMVVGVVIIMVSYFGLRSGGTQILYLLAGAVCVAAGFLLATRYR